MLFDRLAGFIERHRPDMVPEIQRVALFEFPYRAHDVIRPGMFSQKDLDEFFLPFPSVAIEDDATCTFLFDTQPNQLGSGQTRRFIDVVGPKNGADVGAFCDDFGNTPLDKQFQNAWGEKICLITFGELASVTLRQNENYQTAIKTEGIFLLDRQGNILTALNEFDLENIPDSENLARSSLKNVMTAIEELMLVNQNPELFVFERSPAKERKAKKGRIARSHDRPSYVTLYAGEIRKIMGIKDPAGESGNHSGGTKRAHERRRHWRTLRSDRFTHKQGERILIDATWVGASEVVRGKTRAYSGGIRPPIPPQSGPPVPE